MILVLKAHVVQVQDLAFSGTFIWFEDFLGPLEAFRFIIIFQFYYCLFFKRLFYCIRYYISYAADNLSN